tara:strand:- start:304 stop:708 length:405 start_codon:yes stop_codon:yes gene_type:complete
MSCNCIQPRRSLRLHIKRQKNWIKEKLDDVIYDIGEEMIALSENFTSYEYGYQVNLYWEVSDILELLQDFKIDEAEKVYAILKEKQTELLDPEIFMNEGMYLSACNGVLEQFKKIDLFLYITKDFIARYRNSEN